MYFKSYFRLLIVLFSICMLQPAFSQQRDNQFWIFWSNSIKITNQLNLLNDFQLRSEQKIDHISTLLVRGALSYNINDAHSLAAGYAFKRDWMGEELSSKEHRPYQQYQYNFEIKRIKLEVRGRLEERFIFEDQAKFAMRSRAFISAVFPLYSNSKTSGLFAGLQNEIFLNVIHKKNVNGSLLDQNRPYASFGYKFSDKINAAIDYGLLYEREDNGDSFQSLFRISLTTDF